MQIEQVLHTACISVYYGLVTTLSTAAQDNEIPGKTLDWLFQRYCSTDFHDEQYVYYCSGV